ncbi:MAG: LD-carboxypeptidase [Prevotellaceae bacterium]|jgi:muramoyltetrapeptide carboxypeptidase|nr:LD-carboxypeptidase [Prevotellaceae bacterium]
MYPPSLKKGDCVCIISPSGAVYGRHVDGAKIRLESWGLNVAEGDNTRKKVGRYAGTLSERSHDLQFALDNPEIKAIFCSRGGYGLAQMIDKIDFSDFVRRPKWVIGFSDATVLHCAVTHQNTASLHAMMSKNMSEADHDSQPLLLTKRILFGDTPEYNLPKNDYNIAGKATGRIIGGNFTVFMGLRHTPFDLNFEHAILFIEDIGEEAYKIDRMMQNLRLSGALDQISGIIAGQFTGYDSKEEKVESVISEIMKPYRIPVCFDFPSGHITDNYPLILGERAELCVDSTGTHLRYLK